MERRLLVAIALTLAACGGSLTSPTTADRIPNLAGSWDWMHKVPQQGGGFTEIQTGSRINIQQTGASFTATVSSLANSQPYAGVSATGAVTADRSFTMQMRAEVEGLLCTFTGAADAAAITINGTQNCCDSKQSCNAIDFTLRHM